jgi:hypothetical protein
MEIPSWFPWIFVGGFVFMTLSYVASKYNQRKHSSTAFAQDFLSGGILIALMGALVPDYFPKFPVSTGDIGSLSFPSMGGGGGGSGDFDLQVGPLRR